MLAFPRIDDVTNTIGDVVVRQLQFVFDVPNDFLVAFDDLVLFVDAQHKFFLFISEHPQQPGCFGVQSLF